MDQPHPSESIQIPTASATASQLNTSIVPSTKEQRRLQRYCRKAKSLINNEKKMDRFFSRLEIKMRRIPTLGDKLTCIPIFASMLNHYFHKTYTLAPTGTIVAILAALLYLVAPVDAIPDIIPGLGYLDDAGVAAACIALVKSDIDEYLEWREKLVELVDESDKVEC